MPPKSGLLSHEETNFLASYPSHLFTDAERTEFKSKLDKITETFGYRCNEQPQPQAPHP
ncbi:MAG: hypothetical protein IKO32_07770 [Lachnospiraceae bacterium]|nr:hypothetical protein [Lachnospiraceae bacterium]